MDPTKPLGLLFGDPDLADTRPLRVELRRRGARIRLVTRATEVHDEILADRPDLVVLDDRVAQEGGEHFLPDCRESAPGLPFIVLSGGGEQGTPPGPEDGVLFSARKPVSRDTLIGVIEEAFPGRLGEPGPSPRGPHRLLCVDDDETYLGSLARFLKRRGYEVTCHENAHRALRVLSEVRPELAIVDIMMPGMDGLELTRRIHEDSGGTVPVVVLTALGSEETYRRARESGASYCLTKPCRPEDFLNVVDFIAGDLDEEERRLLEKRL